jgi:hypothetical protein
MIAVGYPGDQALLSEKHLAREGAHRVRKEREEFVFHGRWPNENSL